MHKKHLPLFALHVSDPASAGGLY